MVPDHRLYAAPGARSAEPYDRRHVLFTIALCAVWIFTGLFPHDPWKPDEAYTFGLVLHILQTGDWVVPTLAGEPFMEKPPAFFVTAAAFGCLSLWGYTTKRDLSGFGTFLIMGLIGLIIASVVNMFLQSSMMGFIVSVLGVLIVDDEGCTHQFAGLCTVCSVCRPGPPLCKTTRLMPRFAHAPFVRTTRSGSCGPTHTS
jgi:4-amino-4-deoxy-L-arabinose transferase-like glycosyltransferase